MSSAAARDFVAEHCKFIIKRLSHEDIAQMGTCEFSCVITSPDAKKSGAKVPRVHVRMTYFTHTGWDTSDLGGKARYVLVDAQGKKTEEAMIENGLLKEEDVPNWDRKKRFPLGVVRFHPIQILHRWRLPAEAQYIADAVNDALSTCTAPSPQLRKCVRSLVPNSAPALSKHVAPGLGAPIVAQSSCHITDGRCGLTATLSRALVPAPALCPSKRSERRRMQQRQECLQVEWRKFGVTPANLQRVRSEVFGEEWSLRSVLLLMYAAVDISCQMGPLEELESHLTYFINKENYTEHHTREVRNH